MEGFGRRSSQVRTSKEFCTPQFLALLPSIAAIALVTTLLTRPRTSCADTIFVSNYNNPITRGQTFTILKYDSATGSNLGVFANTGLNHPAGLAFDGSGDLYVANGGSNTIEKFTSSGGILSSNGSVFANTGLGSNPQGLAFDNAGNLYVANNGSNTIEKFTPGGVGSVFASTGLDLPLGLAFDGAGNLYVANQHGGSGFGNGTGSIEKFTATGIGSIFASSSGDVNNPPLGIPCGLAFDSAGNLYAANIGLGTIGKFTAQAIGSLFANVAPNAPNFIAIEVPEPSTWALVGVGAIALLAPIRSGLGVQRRRQW